MPVIDPIQAVKVLLTTAALAFVTWLWWDRGHAHEIIKQQQALIAAHEAAGLAQKAEAERKSAAYTEAKRKSDNDAKHLLGRIAWLQKQTPKGCDDAAQIIHEYRTRRP